MKCIFFMLLNVSCKIVVNDHNDFETTSIVVQLINMYSVFYPSLSFSPLGTISLIGVREN